jgi:hypothetical protein
MTRNSPNPSQSTTAKPTAMAMQKPIVMGPSTVDEVCALYAWPYGINAGGASMASP